VFIHSILISFFRAVFSSLKVQFLVFYISLGFFHCFSFFCFSYPVFWQFRFLRVFLGSSKRKGKGRRKKKKEKKPLEKKPKKPYSEESLKPFLPD